MWEENKINKKARKIITTRVYDMLISAEEALQISGARLDNFLKEINDSIKSSAKFGGCDTEILIKDCFLDLVPEIVQILWDKGYTVREGYDENEIVSYLTIEWYKD